MKNNGRCDWFMCIQLQFREDCSHLFLKNGHLIPLHNDIPIFQDWATGFLLTGEVPAPCDGEHYQLGPLFYFSLQSCIFPACCQDTVQSFFRTFYLDWIGWISEWWKKNDILSPKEMEGERVLQRIWCWSGLVSIEMGGTSATDWNGSGIRLVSITICCCGASLRIPKL